MNLVHVGGKRICCLGNREALVPKAELRDRVRELNGTFINANLPALKDFGIKNFEVVDVTTPAGSKKIAFVGLLDLDKDFVACFRGSSFEDAVQTAQEPNEAFKALFQKIREETKCDLVVPVTQQPLALDKELARAHASGQLPLILGGNDTLAVVENVSDCLIVKPSGLDGSAAIIDISWPAEPGGGLAEKPTIKSRLVTLADYSPSPALERVADQLATQMHLLDGAPVADVPPDLLPLSSEGIQSRAATAGTLIATLCREALGCDAALLDASAILEEQRLGGEGSSAVLTYSELVRLVP
eukprot:CAMPEP_0113674574 /NCGR_PEP_ID=MMETSP0038_2-20120614/7501_1 /TAXON_ID=2898 /ORGANISM="Cryptomonas paramecium" /LENGTH=299 /DNA_ID=CAMNT_0000591183 /DNA_START=518 /DNA_END=1414 /DNA_ORIENTATION=+ /assembly_acc=CAM_ASM_000170